MVCYSGRRWFVTVRGLVFLSLLSLPQLSQASDSSGTGQLPSEEHIVKLNNEFSNGQSFGSNGAKARALFGLAAKDWSDSVAAPSEHENGITLNVTFEPAIMDSPFYCLQRNCGDFCSEYGGDAVCHPDVCFNADANIWDNGWAAPDPSMDPPPSCEVKWELYLGADNQFVVGTFPLGVGGPTAITIRPPGAQVNEAGMVFNTDKNWDFSRYDFAATGNLHNDIETADEARNELRPDFELGTFEEEVGPEEGSRDFFQTALHELGHLIGLPHTEVNGVLSVMHPKYYTGIYLFAHDKLNARSLYGDPPDAETNLSVSLLKATPTNSRHTHVDRPVSDSGYTLAEYTVEYDAVETAPAQEGIMIRYYDDTGEIGSRNIGTLTPGASKTFTEVFPGSVTGSLYYVVEDSNGPSFDNGSPEYARILDSTREIHVVGPPTGAENLIGNVLNGIAAEYNAVVDAWMHAGYPPGNPPNFDAAGKSDIILVLGGGYENPYYEELHIEGLDVTILGYDIGNGPAVVKQLEGNRDRCLEYHHRYSPSDEFGTNSFYVNAPNFFGSGKMDSDGPDEDTRISSIISIQRKPLLDEADYAYTSDEEKRLKRAAQRTNPTIAYLVIRDGCAASGAGISCRHVGEGLVPGTVAPRPLIAKNIIENNISRFDGGAGISIAGCEGWIESNTIIGNRATPWRIIRGVDVDHWSGSPRYVDHLSPEESDRGYLLRELGLSDLENNQTHPLVRKAIYVSPGNDNPDFDPSRNWHCAKYMFVTENPYGDYEGPAKCIGGGGIESYWNQTRIRGNIITNNVSGGWDGGGIRLGSMDADLSNNTIRNNSTWFGYNGAGVGCDHPDENQNGIPDDWTVRMFNNDISDNNPGAGVTIGRINGESGSTDIGCWPEYVEIAHSIITDLGYAFPTDGDYDGDSDIFRMSSFDVYEAPQYGNFTPRSGSVAINASTYVPHMPSTDIYGSTVFNDVNAVCFGDDIGQGLNSFRDIGAVERTTLSADCF